MEQSKEINEFESYWKRHSKSSTLEAMMLDSNAKILDDMEKPEILSMLPSLAGKRVLELASGIGRYTEELAKEAKSVVAVEFMKNFHEENQKRMATHDNVTLICEDVTKLNHPQSSVELIFSNWLLMYLSDNDISILAKKILTWLVPGGYLFFRESCFRQSGDAARGSNPSKYRHPRDYITIFRSAFNEELDGVSSFELVRSKSVDAYRKIKNNQGQICFLWKKIVDAKVVPSMQNFLDEQQYSTKSILRYEKIFGQGYVSTGGQETTSEFVAMLNLQKDQHVLDVGCGIGGGDFFMAKKYGVRVTGIDLSTNMIHIALERAMIENVIDVAFEVTDATKVEYTPNSFDVVYSRDTILHIEDKSALFKKFYAWLKPGGKLLISDYCCGEKPASDGFNDYVKQRGYHLLSPQKYGVTIKEAGFSHVNAMDRTGQFMDVLKAELQRTKEQKEKFINATSLDDYQEIVSGWEKKIKRCEEGDQKWGLFYACK